MQILIKKCSSSCTLNISTKNYSNSWRLGLISHLNSSGEGGGGSKSPPISAFITGRDINYSLVVGALSSVRVQQRKLKHSD